MTEAFSTEDIIPRDRWGRPLIIPVDGGTPEPYQRASTFCGALADSTGIGTWKARHVALGVGQHEDLAALAVGLEYGKDNAELDRIIETAIDRAGCNAKANYGTAIHMLTGPGAPLNVPGRMKNDVDAYQELIGRAGIKTVSTERFVVCDDIKVAGTYDHIYAVPMVLFPGGDDDGYVHVVGDKKTGSLHFDQHAVQLAVYAHGEHYYPESRPGDHQRDPIDVNLDWALLVHIPAGKGEATLYWVDIKAGWEAAELASRIHEWRKRKDLGTEVDLTDPWTLDILSPEQILSDHIGGCTTEDGLNALWRTANKRGIWTDDHTLLAKARRELIKGGLI